MCGRFTLAVNPADYADEFGGADFPEQFQPRYNIAPSQPVLAVPNDGQNAATFFLWGLVPSWAKDPTIGNRLINARGETLSEKPAFRGAYKYKRCVIPADGFYEWKTQPGTKTKIPHYIRLKGHKPFALAGLLDEWHATDGTPVRTCTIVTTEPNSLMATIHNRMPLILKPEAISAWLDSSPRAPESLKGLVQSFPAELMELYPVSTLVNSPANDRAECIVAAN
jgi:putative SOS response-associated peptidase YedK